MASISATQMTGAMAWLPTQSSQPVSISPKAAEQAQAVENRTADSRTSGRAQPKADALAERDSASSSPAQSRDAQQAQREVEQVVMQLKMRDQEVRAHEQAHLAAAGAYARGGIRYDYQTGPDGQKYAVGGSVGIDTSPVKGDPQATLQKAMIVQRAALAPAQPSPQDMRVAAQASQMMMQAQSELQAQRMQGKDEGEQADQGGVGENLSVSDRSSGEGQPPSLSAKADDSRSASLARTSFELRLVLQSAEDVNARTDNDRASRDYRVA
jgi:hypothetical protein